MPRILIIDDEPMLLELFRHVFEKAGHEVLLADNGKQALKTIEKTVPDFIVLEASMPETAAGEFIAALKNKVPLNRKNKNIPFLILTGGDIKQLELSEVFSSAKGFTGFLSKMTPPKQLLSKIEYFLTTRPPDN